MCARHAHDNRLARWVFRIGVAVCAVIVVLSVVSIWKSLTYSSGKWAVGVTYGSVVVYHYNAPPSWVGQDGWRIGPAVYVLRLWTEKWTSTYGSPGRPMTMTARWYPTWMFLLAAMIPTVLAWRRQREPLRGHCRKCGYDLTGNVTGRCPECGTKIETAR